MGKVEGRYYVHKDRWGKTHRFEVVDKIPKGYKVWNIGTKNMGSEEYLPLCVTFDKFTVDISSLKTVKMDAEEIKTLNFASMQYGLHSLEECEKRIDCARPKGGIIYKALSIYQKYQEV